MGTLFIFWACGILFLVITVCAYFDEPGYAESGNFTYPFNYRLPLRHRWCRRLAKVSLILSAILVLLLPFFGDDTLQFQMTQSTFTLDIAAYIFTYIILACAWFLAQVLVTIVFALVVDIAKILWRILKALITWIVE